MTEHSLTYGSEPGEVLARLRDLREFDAPTHGGRVLAYVYDSGMSELDHLASEAAEAARSLNGLDPTTFPSIAAMEQDLVSFVRRALGSDDRRVGGRVVGSVTSGGTESCLLAVKTARDLWRDANPELRVALARESRMPRLVVTSTTHAAFHKAAQLFDLEIDVAPCELDGSVRASSIVGRLGDDVALVVVSAPAYPSGAIDPVSEVSKAALALGISCHVDACFGGLALPWWPDTQTWDLRNPGVTSISADLHKFGYAPKGTSVLLHRGRTRHRKQFFATTEWAGYPVVNPTLLGSRSVSPTAAAWAIVHRLGAAGYRRLTTSCARSAHAIEQAVREIPGLAVWGSPTGPAMALIADESVPESERVDPHHLADEIAQRGFQIQHQPGLTQSNGVRLPHSAHLTITPVTERLLPEFIAALRDSATVVRGTPQASASIALAAMRALGYSEERAPSPAAAWRILRLVGAAPKLPKHPGEGGALPQKMAPLMALAEQLPAPVAQALLTELLARVSEP